MEQHIADVVERLQKQELEILRREQLSSLGQMAAGMAHELRNPLMPMKMLVQSAIQKGEHGPGLQGRSLQVVSEEIERLETSIQAFLDFARPPQLEQTTFDIRELCDKTLDLVSARASQQEVDLIRHWPEHPICVHADAGQVRQVILNLVLNSLDAMPEGGTVEVRLETRMAKSFDKHTDSADEKLTELGLNPAITKSDSAEDVRDLDPSRLSLVPSHGSDGVQNKGWCIVSVCDTGIGMPPELVERIFDPFVTTKETGHGLGLSTCRRVLLAHGGTITAENLPDGGACFTFCLRLGH
jgi:signal transduction histidine kinase